ncbi:MAG: FtsX-like permease family protein [Eubacteriaceae bacterium]|nr:FtsX-like permease family protein [Eubacteriaceae bacterium]
MVTLMGRVYYKDIIRTIKNNSKRFVAIMAITALGLTAFFGISGTCSALYRSADRFFDEQILFDIKILSTLGLEEDDVAALQNLPGVREACGGYNEIVYTEVGGMRKKADMAMLNSKGVNMPYIVAGSMPSKAGEIVVTQKYLEESGKSIGDYVDIEEKLDEAAQKEIEKEDLSSNSASSGIDWDIDIDIEEDKETPTFINTRYKISGVAIDPMDISNTSGLASVRSTATSNYTFFVHPADVDTDVYTSVYLLIDGLEELNCYSIEYEDSVRIIVALIEEKIMAQRQQARYNSIITKALEKITDAENTMNEKFEEVDQEFADGWADIRKAKQDVIDGEAELTKQEKDALQKLAEARAEIEDGKTKLLEGGQELANGYNEWLDGKKELDEGKAQFLEEKAKAMEGFAEAEALFAQQQAMLSQNREQALLGVSVAAGAVEYIGLGNEWGTLVGAVSNYTSMLIVADVENPPNFEDPETQSQIFAALQDNINEFSIAALNNPAFEPTILQDFISAAFALGTIEGSQQALDMQLAAYQEQKADALNQLAEAEEEIIAGEEELVKGFIELKEGEKELEDGWAELLDGEKEFEAEEAKALKELADAWQKIADGKKEIADGILELEENLVKFKEKKEEAIQKVADAYAELDDIDMAQWYVQDRGSLESYTGLDVDLSSIGAIGKAFPVLFIVVAVLISLTTMTRMVEEERGQVGTYKALGFRDFEIGWKYVLYALLASALGCVFGLAFGFGALPTLLFAILRYIYVLPNMELYLDVPYAILGIAIFISSIATATCLACRNELRQMPAALMRPKAPKAGNRIFLERMPFIWNRLKFLNKVTARNLFRYKKRLFMTIIGIAGCTALVLAGFAIRDSVYDLMPKQYEHIYKYDLMVVAGADEDDNEKLFGYLDNDSAIKGYLPAQVETVKAINASGALVSLQMVVVPGGANLELYINTPSLSGQLLSFETGGILVTQNAAQLLDLSCGESLALQTLYLDRANAVVNGIVENYLGNSIYISQQLYETLFKEEFGPNCAYCHFADPQTGHRAYAKQLADEDFVMASVSAQAQKEDFTSNFVVLNYVIFLLLGLAAGLAFVVLFALSNTNISERTRELATIKVLGFFDREVHAYVNKETLLLTFIGILGGLPIGHALSGLLLWSLKMPSLTFALYVRQASYVIAAITTLAFALLVNLFTNRILNKINMVEALKSIE